MVVLLSDKREHILTLSINRPERRNALNAEVLSNLIDIFKEIEPGGETRVVILRGAGEKSFCAGADIKAMGTGKTGNIIQDTMECVINCPCPVIAMIYGYAIGAGCDLAAACDIRIIADSARIGINPVKLGSVYYPVSIQRFISIIGAGYTKELFLTGRFLTAQRAKEIGLVNHVVPNDELEVNTYLLAREIAENAPLAVAWTKSIINTFLNRNLSPEEKTKMQTIMEHSWQTEDAREGLAAFAEKRKPIFRGR